MILFQFQFGRLTMWTIYGNIREPYDAYLSRSVSYINSDPDANSKIVKLVISAYKNSEFQVVIHPKEDSKSYQLLEKAINKFRYGGTLLLREDLNTITFISNHKKIFGFFVRSALFQDPNLPVNVIWEIEQSLRFIRSLGKYYGDKVALLKSFGYEANEKVPMMLLMGDRILNAKPRLNLEGELTNNNQTEISNDSNVSKNTRKMK